MVVWKEKKKGALCLRDAIQCQAPWRYGTLCHATKSAQNQSRAGENDDLLASPWAPNPEACVRAALRNVAKARVAVECRGLCTLVDVCNLCWSNRVR